MSNQENSSENIPTVFEYGSAWIRADFHMHTIADKEFKYSGDKASFQPEYIDALKSAGIRISVVTNHNKFDLPGFKSLAKTAKREDIFLLPGLELSVKDGSNGIHMLVVFHKDWIYNQENEDYINSFLNVTFAGQSNFENENGRSNHDLIETIRELDKFDRDYFLICAHVETNNGLWGGLSGGRLGELGKSDLFRERCLGFQKVKTRDKRKQVKEWLHEWYPAEVEGCDCKSIPDIGKGSATYLKVGAYTFESVKFALLDKTNRVSTQLPKLEHSYIKNIAFEGDKLSDRSINFSPELNTFIGIRGSGKSTILESIRYALDISFGKNTADQDYKEGSVKNALGSGGKISVTAIDRHGREYEVRRIVGEQSDVYVQGELQPGINIRETVLHKPIYFGQKDLSNTGAGFENDLVEKLVGEKLTDIRSDITKQRQNVVELARRLLKLSDIGEKQKEYEAKKQDAQFRLKTFKAHGVEEKLQKQVDYEKDSQIAKDLSSFVSNYSQELTAFVGQYADEFSIRKKYESKQNKAFFNELFEIFGRVEKGTKQIQAIVEETRAASSDITLKVKEFEELKSALKDEFAEISRDLSEELKSSGATAIDPDEFLKLRKTIEGATQFLAALAKEKEQNIALNQQLSVSLSELNELWHQEFTVIKNELEVINNQDTALQIDIDYKGDKVAFLKYVKDIFRGSKLRETTLTELVSEFSDGAGLYRDLDKAKSMVGGSVAPFEEYFWENLSALLTWQVPNRYTINYHGKELKNHSLGQRASALILFVLSQRDNDVVIIDQPEDDLDNQTIYEDVIKLVRKLKPKTQFIFATHNPNIPVLGDAEQVVACAYDEDAISTVAGSIDKPEIQDAIVGIMEGGTEAFQRRKEIYQIWKRQNS